MNIAPQRIEIIGGGLGGLSLGLALQRAGIPVVLYEAGEYPRHRVCGEFITGLDELTISRLGIGAMLADALQHRTVAWHLGGQPPHFSTLPRPALGISRYTLDQRLADAFVAAGGVLRQKTRTIDLSPKPGRVFANGRRQGRSPWLGLKVHARGLRLSRDLELHVGDEAYVGLAPIGHDTVNVCGLFRRRQTPARGSQSKNEAPGQNARPYEFLLAYLDSAGLNVVAERLRDADVDLSSASAVAGVEFSRRVVDRDRICLGDACAMIPPFTGNGMAMAFQSAAAAWGPVQRFSRGEQSWAETCRATNAALRGRFRLRLASANLLHPFLLQPRQQRWLAALSRAHLLPFRPLYSLLH